MQAIVTKYICPTNTKGSRISVMAQAGRMILEWDDSLNSEENHALAAHAFCVCYAWHGRLATGALPDGRMVHVFADE